MSLDDILDAIEASGVNQIETTRKDAQEQATSVLNEAKEDAEEIKKNACNERLQSAKRERARMLHEMRLHQLRIEEDARAQLIYELLDRTRQGLQEFRSDERYPDTLRRLTEGALKALASSTDGDESLILESDPRDEKQVEQILKDLSYEVQSREGDKVWGGVTASSADGRVKVVNTLEARMERAIPYLRMSFSIRLKERADV